MSKESDTESAQDVRSEADTPADSLANLTRRLRQFADVRDWDQFHSPKNLAMALATEVGELLEQFQWLTDEQSRALPDEKRAAVLLELADVLIYLVRLADKLDIDLPKAAHEKMMLNEVRYPASKARGSAKKYNEL